MKKIILVFCIALLQPALAFACSPPALPGPIPQEITKAYAAKPASETQSLQLKEFEADQATFFQAWTALNPCSMYPEEVERYEALTTEEKNAYEEAITTIKQKWGWL